MRRGGRGFRTGGQGAAQVNPISQGYFKITTGSLTAEQARAMRGKPGSLGTVGQQYFSLVRVIGSTRIFIGDFTTRTEAEHAARLICRDENVRLVFALD
ncbi:hypothetical protein [Szabonella alba]|uniref:SPOR domain-containing protein n=1 Tax=Szabonella alba TaxID=2804194 RepID=A0A8K0VHJ7_9RHOB|nr:hypothetical protein [Szabonella alba]MBL4919315.1 hypothetical protein [Szabonella alba]